MLLNSYLITHLSDFQEKHMSTNESAEESQNSTVQDLMREIRARVRSALERGELKVPEYVSSNANLKGNSDTPVIFSEELKHLNNFWDPWSKTKDPSSHRKFLGRLIVKAKQSLRKLIKETLLGDYFESEKEYRANLVRFLNSTARYIDSRDETLFFELIKKFDHDLHSMSERVSLIVDELDGRFNSFERMFLQKIAESDAQIKHLSSINADLNNRLSNLDELTRGLERILALSKTESKHSDGYFHSSEVENSRSKLGLEYLILENRYRGSEDLIKSRLKDYVQYFSNASKPVLDIGCGRGEFLSLLTESNIPCKGIDLDEAMVATCKDKHLPVEFGNALHYLSAVEDGSIGGVIGIQIVEHLTKTQLEELFSLCKRKVTTGGKILFETINPGSLTALSHNFFKDPTHVWPLHPETLRFMMEMKGLATVEILYRSPYPENALLAEVETSSFLPPRWNALLERWNGNVRQLNSLLYGSQDYAVLAENIMK
jgi:2-polyprenyl-3-methyl-5-hydroxy-6-metoxy-1,4-benzoquinol methylase